MVSEYLVLITLFFVCVFIGVPSGLLHIHPIYSCGASLNVHIVVPAAVY